MKLLHKREYYIPANAAKVAAKDSSAVAYLYTDTLGKPSAVFFAGRAQKPAGHHYYKSPESRAGAVSRFFAARATSERNAAERRAQRNKPHGLEKGMILYTSWGYEQTNVSFYIVTDVPSACYVIVQEIASTESTDSPTYSHGMASHVVPNPEVRRGEPIRRKVDMGGAPSISIDSRGIETAWVWDGKPVYCSWYY